MNKLKWFSVVAIGMVICGQSTFGQGLDFMTNSKIVCDNDIVTIINTTPDKEKYDFEWKLPNGDGGLQNGDFATIFTEANFGDGTIKLKRLDKTTKKAIDSISKKLDISFFKRPDIQITSSHEKNGKLILCQDVEFTLEAVMADPNLVVSNLTWKIGLTPYNNTNPVKMLSNDVAGQVVGDHVSLTIIDENGCFQKYEKRDYITVKKDVAMSPVLQIKTPDTEWKQSVMEVCDSETDYSVQFLAPASSTATIQSFEWTLPDGTKNTTDKVINANAKGYGYHRYYLKVTDSQGCESSNAAVTLSLRDFTKSIDFRARDSDTKAEAVLSKTQCSGNYIFSPVMSADLVKWDVNSDGTYDEELTDSDKTSLPVAISETRTVTMYAQTSGVGCSGTVSKELTIEPIAEFTFDVDKTFSCKKDDFTFTVTSNIVGANVAIKYDTNSWDTKSHTFNFGHGLHTVTMVPSTPAQCKATQQSIAVEVAIPYLSFKVTQAPNHCIPHDVKFFDSVVYAPQTSTDKIVKYMWDFDNDGTPDLEYGDTHQDAAFTYTIDKVYTPQLRIKTELGCEYMKDTVIPVGDKSIIDYKLEDVNVCAQENVTYLDFSTDPSKIQTISIAAIASGANIVSSGAVIKGPPTNGSSALLTDFDTLGVHDIYITAEYNQCTTKRSDPKVIDIKGPIISIGEKKTCEMAEDSAYFYITTRMDADEDIEWTFEEVNDKGEFIRELNKQTAGITDTIPYKFPKAGRFKISAQTVNTVQSCTYRASHGILIEKMDIDLKLSTNAICLDDSVHRVMQSEVFGYTGLKNVSNFMLFVQHADSPTQDTLYIARSSAYAIDSLRLYNKGVYKLTLSAYNSQGCPFSDAGFIKVYEPVALIETKDNTGCLPITVNYKNLTTSDTTLQKFYWDTNSNTNATGTTTSLDEIYTAEYTTKSAITTTIVAETIEINGKTCRDTFELKGAVNPIIPGAQFTVTDKLCLGTEATINRTEDVATDSIHWRFTATDSWQPIKDLNLTHKYEDEGSYELSLRAGRQTGYGYCTNIETKTVNVKNLIADISITAPDDKCFQNLGTKNKWVAQNIDNYTDVTYNWTEGGLKRFGLGHQITLQHITEPGVYPIVLEMQTSFIGCKKLIDTAYAEVQGAIFDFTVSKPIVCVREEFEIELVNKKNIDINPYSIVFGNGDSKIGTTDTVLKFSYNSVIDAGFYIISINGACQKEPVTRKIDIYKIESRYVQNGEEQPLAGCPPLGVLYTNRSIGQDIQTWNFGNGQTSTALNPDSVYYTVPGTYTSYLAVENSDCRDTIRRSVTVYPEPIATWGAEKTINCEDDDATILAQANEPYTYQWHPADLLDNAGKLNPTYLSADSTRSFHVTATNTFGCSIYDSVLLTVQNRPQYSGAPKDSISYLRLGEYVKFRPTDTLIVLEQYDLGNDSLPNIKYKWTPATYLSCDTCANPLISIPDGVEKLHYSVQMNDIYGCFEETALLDFTVMKNTMAALPDAFTPNGDGNNDILYLRGWAIRQLLELRVYNRLGQLVFETDDISKGWDGTYNGKEQPTDIYAYTFKIINFAGEELFFKGDFKLVR